MTQRDLNLTLSTRRPCSGVVRGALTAVTVMVALTPQLAAQGPATIPATFQFANTTLTMGGETPVYFQMTTMSSFQGFSVSLTYDPTLIEVSEILSSISTEAVPAEYFNAEILPGEGRFSIDVVADAEAPFDGQEFVGTGEPMIVAVLMVGIAGPGPETTVLQFVDGLGDPPMYNRLIVSSQAAAPDTLIDGVLTIPRVALTFRIADTPVFPGEPTAVPFQVLIGFPFQGLSASVAYDPAVVEILDISALNYTPEEYFRAEIFPIESRFTIDILASADPSLDGRTLPGSGYFNTLAQVTVLAPAGPGPAITMMRPVDGLGDPTVQNRFIVSNQPMAPDNLVDGTLFISRIPSVFQFADATARPGERVGVPFQVTTDFPFQALSASVGYDRAVVDISEVSFLGTATEAAGAEYFTAEIFPAQGGLVIGILVDALPPFEGQLFPSIGSALTVAQVMVDVLPGAAPGTTELRFVDGYGSVPYRNLVVVSNNTRVPDVLSAGTLTVPGVPHFVRGDVNQGHGVDLSDAIYLVSFLFRGGRAIPCRDAADANDDESVDLADAIFIIRYCFQGGSRPPSPFPDPGPDPTASGIDLGCESSAFPPGPESPAP